MDADAKINVKINKEGIQEDIKNGKKLNKITLYQWG